LRPLQGKVALHLAARPLQHRARRNRAGGDIVGARLRARGPERLRHVLLRQDYDCPLLVAADRISLRTAHRLSLFPLYPHDARAGDSTPMLVLGRTADVDVLLRAIESGAVTKIQPVGILSPSLADRGQAIRGISVVGGPDDLESVVDELSKRGTNVTRLVLTPSALAPEAKPETILNAGKALGAGCQPPSLAR